MTNALKTRADLRRVTIIKMYEFVFTTQTCFNIYVKLLHYVIINTWSVSTVVPATGIEEEWFSTYSAAWWCHVRKVLCGGRESDITPQPVTAPQASALASAGLAWLPAWLRFEHVLAPHCAVPVQYDLRKCLFIVNSCIVCAASASQFARTHTGNAHLHAV